MNSHQIPLGSGASAFVATLEQEGFTALSWRKITNPEFSVPGAIITLGSDTISVFEYDSEQKASQEASALAVNYNKNIAQNTWAEQTHLYTKGNLIIYYFGMKQSVTTALNTFAGDSLVAPATETKKSLVNM